ncbi:MAG: formylglycine-generating enzyme family protein [Cryomorphaceae bacterium]|jgi:antitoxin component YwqK of YwqJK toxin-antitoxin module|nr:formylglycine-generating enzyme family protein [Cryomorphaceae bacterium]
MFRLIFILFLFTTGIQPLFSQYYPVGKMTFDARLTPTRFKQVQVEPFSISALVTVGEFKRYLKAIKRDSSATFYKAQLPKSRSIDEKLIHDLFANPSLNNCPMPGVSWTVARNYCQWLNRQSAANGLTYLYDLPLLSEMMAYNAIYGLNDTNVLETWTLDSYDESMYEFTNTLNYQYNAKISDPPVMKRKTVFGGSFHMQNKSSDSSIFHRNFTFEYQDSASRYIGFRVVRKTANVDYNSMNVDALTVDYGMEDNHMNGIYKETYSDGQVKVLGCFKEGQRIGVWTVWDQSGKMQVQRSFENNFTVDLIYPETNNPYSSLYASYPEYQLIRNNQGFYSYLFVEERSVVYSKRIWRELNVSNEPKLFQHIDFSLLIDEIFKNEINWYYYGENGEFKTAIPRDSLSKLSQSVGSWDLERIQVKEDFFFNADMLLSDCRQVGISFYENKKDKKPMFTLYYPYIRMVLSDFQVKYSKNDAVKNLDDIFFFHDYRGTIVQTSSFDENQNELKSSEFDLSHELNKLITEHALWLIYGR